jgi:hypothetical protein
MPCHIAFLTGLSGPVGVDLVDLLLAQRREAAAAAEVIVL